MRLLGNREAHFVAKGGGNRTSFQGLYLQGDILNILYQIPPKMSSGACIRVPLCRGVFYAVSTKWALS